MATKNFNILNPTPEGFYQTKDVYYEPQGKEIELALAAFAAGLHLAVDGPTGCGKSTFTEKIGFLLGRGHDEIKKLNLKPETEKIILKKTERYWETGLPLFTTACNEDLSADDLIGRDIGIEGDWLDGNGILVAKHGGILYLDEPPEARKDTLVVIHALTDDRAILPAPKLGIVQHCEYPVMVVMTYNSAYQDPRKKFKPSMAQRFVHIPMGYPKPDLEKKILMGHTKIDKTLAERMIKIAAQTRSLAAEGKIKEGASPRELIMGAKLIQAGINPYYALISTLAYPVAEGNQEIISAIAQYIKDFGFRE